MAVMIFKSSSSGLH